MQIVKNLLLLLVLTACVSCKQQPPYQNPSLSADERARDLLEKLTLEEKVQLMMNNSPGIERLGILPYEWWNEALHGVGRAGQATVFPQSIALAATFDKDAVYETFNMISDEARAKHHDFKRKGEYKRYQGLTFWTPNINIFRDPRWGRGMETYGEDPYLTSRMGVAVVQGLQGDGSTKYDKLHACAKHYAVHSGPEWNRHSFDAKKISERDLRETYLPAFKALVTEAGVKEVMCAYNRFEGLPCCASDELLIHILREEWGYDNIVVSDCGAISDFYREGCHDTHPDAASASAAAVIAGTDLECGEVYHALNDVVKQGLISEEQVDKSLYRLLRARFQLGLMDDDKEVSWSSIPLSVVESDAHKAMALEMARKSIVLLNNEKNTLPLSKDLKKVAVIGPAANDSVMQWANYNGFPTKTVTLLEGIQNKLPKGAVIYEKGCDYVTSSTAKSNYKELINRVKEAEVIVFAGGISPELEGEEMNVNLPGFKQGDRTNIDLPEVQLNLLKALKKLNKPIVFVLCSGSTMALPWQDKNLDAVLAAWYPGQEGGTAVADVLFGDYNPAGRLPLTFYRSSADLPDFEDYDMSKGRTYRYFKGKPLYPFGHGLSYTTFEYENGSLNKLSLKVGESVKLSVNVKNTGRMDGDEVVQVYVRNPQDSEGPIKSLRAFERVFVKSGETETVHIDLPADTFEFFDRESGLLCIKPGTYEVLYGSSSDDEALISQIVKVY